MPAVENFPNADSLVLSAPCTKAFAITKSDSAFLTENTRAIYVGGGGDLAVLMTGDLARATSVRFVCGAMGGLALPGLLMAWCSGDGGTSPAMVAMVVLMLALNFAGELLERYLFFAAVVAPKMPGAPTA